ncbi:OprD family porin [Pseudomonas aeruginosa]|nr:OprD family porin [Pseudomonas aeruginosa]
MLKKRICLLALGIATASQAMANDQEAAKGFVEDSHLDLFFRNGYISRDYKHGRQDKAEWGQAATATFTSGFTQGTGGTLITSKEIEGLELNAGRFTAESRKSAEGRDSGGLKSINVFGGKYAFTDHFNASLYASDVEDVLKKQYINLNYTIPLQADQSLNFDFNGYRTKLDSDFADQNFNGNRDNKIWSLAASYTIDAHTFMIAHQRNTGDTGYNYGWYQNAGGIGDGGTTIWLANSYWSDFNAEDERSWQVSYALDFAKYGVPGLTYRVAYVRGDNIKTAETSNGKEREIFNQVQYVVQSGPAKDLTLRLRSSFLRVSNDARSYNDDGNEIRAFVEYPFSVF